MARAQHTAEGSICYLCGLRGADEKEHFIPKCFYENKSVPHNGRYTLPAHAECNRSTSEDEQWVFTHYALSNPLGGGSMEREGRAVRGLMRDRAAL